MSLPQHILYGVGGTVTRSDTSRPSSAYARIIDPDSGEKMPATACTISSVNTVLTAAANSHDFSITVSNATGFATGLRYMIQDDPEEVLVRSVSGTTVNLRRPLLYDHANNATIQGATITLSVNATYANSLFFDGAVEWNIDGSVHDVTAIECTKYPMRSTLCTDQDILDIFPTFSKVMPSEEQMTALRENARQRVLSRIGAKAPDRRARVMLAGTEFKHATALAALMSFYMPQSGDSAQQLYDRFRMEFEAEVDRMMAIQPRDADQDGVVEGTEQLSPWTVVLTR